MILSAPEFALPQSVHNNILYVSLTVGLLFIYTEQCFGYVFLLTRVGCAFLDLCSRVPGIYGKQEREFLQERENEERGKVGTLISRS